MTLPDGKEYFIEKEILLGILWVIGNREEQQKMVPQKLTRVKWYETVLGIKATKDIHKGEMINVPIKLTLPAEESDIISEIRRPSGSSDLIVPGKVIHK